MTSILLLVDQPWQANFGMRIVKEVKKVQPSLDFDLAFTDYFTFFLRRDYLSGIKNSFIGEVFTQEKIYTDWQDDTNEFDFSQDYLTEWERINCKSRTLDEIARTNQWLYGNERDKYQRKITGVWRTKILYDTIIWCENLMETSRPDIVISIERCTSPTNILFEICRRENIPFLTFIPSRIMNRWVMREDLSYGMSKELTDEISRKYSSPEHQLIANEIIDEILTSRTGSYSSPSHKIVNDSKDKQKKIIQNLLTELRRWCGRVYGRIFIQPKERSITATRVLEYFPALSYIELKKILINSAHLLGFRRWGITTVPQVPFFLWALHMRPEGSVLVSGDARDEVEELLLTASQLPDGYFLAVKENPEMFGLRNRGFYRKLRKNRKIILIDLHVPTFDLLEKSLGAVGISGTVLLEAAFFGKPSCALGHPEFESFLIGNGWDTALSFFKNVISGDFDNPRERILPYVAYVIANSNDVGFSFEGDLETHEACETISSVATKICDYTRNSLRIS